MTVVKGSLRIAIQQSENTRLWFNNINNGCFFTPLAELSLVKSSTVSSSSSSENPKLSPVYGFFSPSTVCDGSV